MAERNSRNRVFASPWMPLGPFSETHFMVATDIASAFLNTWLGRGQGAGLVEETALQLPFTYLPAVFLRVCVPLSTTAGRNGKQAYG